MNATGKSKVAHLKNVPSANQDHMLREIDEDTAMVKKTNKVILLAYLLLIVLGITTGFILSGNGTALSGISQKSITTTNTEAGASDMSTFKDSAIGVIEKGGLDGEGTHKLTREGGPSQTAYLVSSVIDLDQYVGKKVKVWGQTLAAKKAAWLLDVGKVEAQ